MIIPIVTPRRSNVIKFLGIRKFHLAHVFIFIFFEFMIIDYKYANKIIEKKKSIINFSKKNYL